MGGSSYWWPAIDGKCGNPASVLSRRVKLLSNAVADMKKMHPGSKESIYLAGILRDKFLEEEEKRKKYDAGILRSKQMAEEDRKRKEAQNKA
jgi:hypothetical protein